MMDGPSDRDLLRMLWDESTAKPPPRTPVGTARNLAPFALWGAEQFGQDEVCRIMAWSTRDFDRLTGVIFEESTARQRRGGFRGKGAASEAARQWMDAMGPLSTKSRW